MLFRVPEFNGIVPVIWYHYDVSNDGQRFLIDIVDITGWPSWRISWPRRAERRVRLPPASGWCAAPAQEKGRAGLPGSPVIR